MAMTEQGEKVKKNNRTEEHFAALNSGRGFVSFYKDVFGARQIKRRYIIKGGPGTGKSSFMRRVARIAEERGRRVEYFRCSSDPESLDGIIIDGETAFMDGTAPHTYEPEIAGAADDIVNLGAFWDSDRLYQNYNEIAVLSSLKSGSYSKAYRFLSAAMNVFEINSDMSATLLKEEKMLDAAERIMRRFPRGRGYSVKYGITSAIGMGGCVRLDTYERVADKVYCIYDSYELGSRFLLMLIGEAKNRDMPIKVSYKPLCPDMPDALFLVDERVAFVISENIDISGAAKINMKRFVDNERADAIKSEYRANRRLIDALIESATEALADAGKYHFRLEKIYTSCMDFEAENSFVEDFCEKLFG